MFWYVNGEASVIAGGVEMGVSVDGVTIEETIYLDGIQVDTRGPHVPGDYQYFLTMYTITCELVYFDWDVVQNWLTGLPANPPAFGTWKAAGTLMMSPNGANTQQLIIKSTPAGTGLSGQAQCWEFPYAFLIDAQETKLGTVRSTWKLKFQANVPYQAGTTDGQIQLSDGCGG
jgi:hypothetical protein